LRHGLLQNYEKPRFVGVKQELHWCQLNAKSSSRKKLKFLANSESHLKDD